MLDVHTAILEDHTWDGRTNDRGVAKGWKALHMSCRLLDDGLWQSNRFKR